MPFPNFPAHILLWFHAGCPRRLAGGWRGPCLVGSESAMRMGGESMGSLPPLASQHCTHHANCLLFTACCAPQILHVFKAGELVHRVHARSSSPVPTAFQGQPLTDVYSVQSSEPSSEPGRREVSLRSEWTPLPLLHLCLLV